MRPTKVTILALELDLKTVYVVPRFDAGAQRLEIGAGFQLPRTLNIASPKPCTSIHLSTIIAAFQRFQQ